MKGILSIDSFLLSCWGSQCDDDEIWKLRNWEIDILSHWIACSKIPCPDHVHPVHAKQHEKWKKKMTTFMQSSSSSRLSAHSPSRAVQPRLYEKRLLMSSPVCKLLIFFCQSGDSFMTDMICNRICCQMCHDREERVSHVDEESVSGSGKCSLLKQQGCLFNGKTI